MKIAIVDTLYSDFIRTVPLQGGTYAEELQRLMEYRFGTHDAYSRTLRNQGHEVIDIVTNHVQLQQLWADENLFDSDTGSIAWAQIDTFRPDVLFCQDLGYFTTGFLQAVKREGILLAGQCSCRFTDDEKLKQFDVLFTSFPFYVDRFKSLGVEGVFLPLAFDPIILERAQIPAARTYPVSFVGGVGRHWKGAESLFTQLANLTPIQFWGYGWNDGIGMSHVMGSRYRGEAWGMDMYRVYLQSLIVVNRHGEIAGGYSNNLRMFEATGCGALLLTEESPNIGDYFEPGKECVTYRNADDAVEKIRYYLDRPDELIAIARAGQEKTLRCHTYAQRLPLVSKTLEALAVKA